MSDPILDEQQRGWLQPLADRIYRNAIRKPFDLVLGDGWNVFETPKGEYSIVYAYIRLDFPAGVHWLTRFKLPDFLDKAEAMFEADATRAAKDTLIQSTGS